MIRLAITRPWGAFKESPVPKYNVTVARIIQEIVIIPVDANNDREARSLAQSMIDADFESIVNNRGMVGVGIPTITGVDPD